ncbi:Sorbitol dehydrogenase (plasmid) [Variovorax sp. SRS16]|uniref:zinc-binding dehydrogenase n=1 Tax=Variovorax sp. SRS16 TaxID=282217 RepID=UPI001317AE59|nr:Sorbitol dehydrogenase [Variovorax sp. SRS16]
MDINEDRLERAKAFGADVVLNPAFVDVREAIRDLTQGLGADYALETSASASGVVDAIKCLRYWGTVAFVGMGQPVAINIASDVIARQINMLGSWTFSSAIMNECARFAVARKVEVDAVFTDRWQLEQAAQAYKLLDAQSAGKGVFVL